MHDAGAEKPRNTSKIHKTPLMPRTRTTRQEMKERIGWLGKEGENDRTDTVHSSSSFTIEKALYEIEAFKSNFGHCDYS